jgi:hypothetical protein
MKGTGKAAAIYLAMELIAGAVIAGIAVFHFFLKK